MAESSTNNIVVGNQSQMRSLYDHVKKYASDIDFGTVDEFMEGMSDEENRKWLHDTMSERGLLKNKDLDAFNKRLGFNLVKMDPNSQTGTGPVTGNEESKQWEPYNPEATAGRVAQYGPVKEPDAEPYNGPTMTEEQAKRLEAERAAAEKKKAEQYVKNSPALTDVDEPEDLPMYSGEINMDYTDKFKVELPKEQQPILASAPLTEEEAKRVNDSIRQQMFEQKAVNTIVGTQMAMEQAKSDIDQKIDEAKNGEAISYQKIVELGKARAAQERRQQAASSYVWDYLVRRKIDPMYDTNNESEIHIDADKVPFTTNISYYDMKKSLTNDVVDTYAQVAYGKSSLSYDERKAMRNELESMMAGEMVDMFVKRKAPRSNYDLFCSIVRSGLMPQTIVNIANNFGLNTNDGILQGMSDQAALSIATAEAEKTWGGKVLTSAGSGTAFAFNMLILGKIMGGGFAGELAQFSNTGLVSSSAFMAPGSAGTWWAIKDVLANNIYTNCAIRGAASLGSMYMQFGRLGAINATTSLLSDENTVKRYGNLTSPKKWFKEIGCDLGSIIEAYHDEGMTGVKFGVVSQLTGGLTNQVSSKVYRNAVKSGKGPYEAAEAVGKSKSVKLSKALGFGAEWSFFSLGEIDQINEMYKDNPEMQIGITDYEDWTKVFVGQLGFLGALKAMNIGHPTQDQYKMIREQGRKFVFYGQQLLKNTKLELNKDDQNALAYAGVGKFSEFNMDLLNALMRRDGDSNQTVYERIMKEQKMPLMTLYKLKLAVEHQISSMGYTTNDDGAVVMSTNPMDFAEQAFSVPDPNSNGFRVSTFNADQMLLEHKTFKTKEDADAYAEMINSRCLVNKIRLVESLIGDSRTTLDDAINTWADQNGVGRGDAIELFNDYLDNRENASPHAKEMAEAVKKDMWRNVNRGRVLSINTCRQRVKDSTGIDIAELLDRDPLTYTKDEVNAINEYNAMLWEVKKVATTDPDILAVEKAVDPETGMVREGVTKDGREVTVKGSGDAVVINEKANPAEGKEQGKPEMVSKDDVTITKETPAEDILADINARLEKARQLEEEARKERRRARSMNPFKFIPATHRAEEKTKESNQIRKKAEEDLEEYNRKYGEKPQPAKEDGFDGGYSFGKEQIEDFRQQNNFGSALVEAYKNMKALVDDPEFKDIKDYNEGKLKAYEDELIRLGVDPKSLIDENENPQPRTAEGEDDVEFNNGYNNSIEDAKFYSKEELKSRINSFKENLSTIEDPKSLSFIRGRIRGYEHILGIDKSSNNNKTTDEGNGGVPEVGKAVAADAPVGGEPAPLEAPEAEVKGRKVRAFDAFTGNEFEGEDVGPGQRVGDRSIRTADGKLHDVPVDDVTYLEPEPQPRTADLGGQSPAGEVKAEGGTVPAAEVTGEQAGAQTAGKKPISVDQKGMPTVENDPARVAEWFVNGESGLPADLNKQILQQKVDQANRELEAANKKQPKLCADGDIARMQRELQAIEAEKAAKKAAADYWNSVNEKATAMRTQAKMKAENEKFLASREDEKVQKRVQKVVAEIGDPSTVREAVLMDFLKPGGFGLNKAEIQKELGAIGDNIRKEGLMGQIARGERKNLELTIQSIAEGIASEHGCDVQDVRNEIIDVLTTYGGDKARAVAELEKIADATNGRMKQVSDQESARLKAEAESNGENLNEQVKTENLPDDLAPRGNAPFDIEEGRVEEGRVVKDEVEPESLDDEEDMNQNEIIDRFIAKNADVDLNTGDVQGKIYRINGDLNQVQAGMLTKVYNKFGIDRQGFGQINRSPVSRVDPNAQVREGYDLKWHDLYVEQRDLLKPIYKAYVDMMDKQIKKTKDVNTRMQLKSLRDNVQKKMEYLDEVADPKFDPAKDYSNRDRAFDVETDKKEKQNAFREELGRMKDKTQYMDIVKRVANDKQLSLDEKAEYIAEANNKWDAIEAAQLDKAAKATGIENNLVKRLSDAMGVRIVADPKVFGSEKENGLYDRDEGVIYINPNGNKMVNLSGILGHETLHPLEDTAGYEDLANALIEIGFGEFHDVENEIMKIQKLYNDHFEMRYRNGLDRQKRHLYWDEAKKEVVANVLKNQIFRGAEGRKMLDQAIERMKDQSMAGRFCAKLRDMYDLATTAWNNGWDKAVTKKQLMDARDHYADLAIKYREQNNKRAMIDKTISDNRGDEAAYVDEKNNIQMNLETYEGFRDNLGVWHEGTRERMSRYFDDKIRAGLMKQEDKQKMLDKMDYWANYMRKVAEFQKEDGTFAFAKFREWNEKQPQYRLIGKDVEEKVLSTIVKNGEYPVNLELTTDCIKRETFTQLLNEIVRLQPKALKNMNPGEITIIQDMMKSYGIQTACPLCFVEGKRLMIRNWAQTIADNWNVALAEALAENKMLGNWKPKIKEVTEVVDGKKKVRKYVENIDEMEELLGAFGFASDDTVSAETWDVVKERNDMSEKKEFHRRINSVFETLAGRKGGLLDEDQKSLEIASQKAYDRMMEMERQWMEDHLDEPWEMTKDQIDEIEGILADGKKVVHDKMKSNVLQYKELQHVLKAEDLMGSTGLDKLRGFGDEAHRKLFSNILSSFGAGTPKVVQRAEPYAGEILDRSMDSANEKARKVGGARLFSFSDFDISKIFDIMQIFWDEEARQSKLQSYSKEVPYILFFGRGTNAKINMSTLVEVRPDKALLEEYKKAPKSSKNPNVRTKDKIQHEINEYAGLVRDENGQIIGMTFSGSHSVSPEFAEEIFHDDDYNSDCGATTVGVSVNHTIYSMMTPWIRQVIPFHLSGMPIAARNRTDVLWYRDATKEQNTGVWNGKQWVSIHSEWADDNLRDKNGNKVKDFDFYEGEDKPEWDLRQRCIDYVKWCKKNGFRPKFEWCLNADKYVEFCKNNGYEPNQQILTEMRAHETEGVYDNYYKVIADFNPYKPVFDGEGNYIGDVRAPHKPIKCDFSTDQRMLDLMFGVDDSMLANRERNIEHGNKMIKKLAADAVGFLTGKKSADQIMSKDPDAFRNQEDADLYINRKRSWNIEETEEAGPVRSRNFKHWFGDWEHDPENSSKVVDENGKPLVVYHGTRDYGFDEFNTSEEWNEDNIGSHFGSKNAAADFADSDHTYAVYLNIKKPWKTFDFFADMYDNAYLDAMKDMLDEMDPASEEKARQMMKEVVLEAYPKMTAKQFDKAMDGSFLDEFDNDEGLFEDGSIGSEKKNSESRKKLVGLIRSMMRLGGFDGIEYENWYEGNNEKSYMILDPEQVKSATGNNGDYDPKKRNIYFDIEEEDIAYDEALNTGNEKEQEKLVRDAAENSMINPARDEKGRAKKLFHGTGKFGFTEFRSRRNSGAIFTVDRSNVSANYAGNDHYAGKRNINKGYKETNDPDGIIENAKSVLNQEWKKATPEMREKVIDRVEKEAMKVAEKMDMLGNKSNDYPEDPDFDMMNAVGWVQNIIYDAAYGRENGNEGDGMSKMLADGYERYKENRDIIRAYKEKHYDELDEDTKIYLDYLTGYELGDVAIDAGLSMSKAFSSDEIATVTGDTFLTIDELNDTVKKTKDIGSYQLYGDLGDNPLTVECNDKNWYSLDFNGMHNTDDIAEWAKENGYTSVEFKNIYDYGDKANVYVFFESNKLKSADNITYDDNGNIIPLSKRFDQSNRDLRFDLEEGEDKGNQQPRTAGGADLNNRGLNAEQKAWLYENAPKESKHLNDLDYYIFLRNQTTLDKNGNRVTTYTFKDNWLVRNGYDKRMSIEDAFEKVYKPFMSKQRENKKTAEDLENYLIKLVNEGKASVSRSNQSESMYYNVNGIQLRFSGHKYPTGSMTNVYDVDGKYYGKIDMTDSDAIDKVRKYTNLIDEMKSSRMNASFDLEEGEDGGMNERGSVDEEPAIDYKRDAEEERWRKYQDLVDSIEKEAANYQRELDYIRTGGTDKGLLTRVRYFVRNRLNLMTGTGLGPSGINNLLDQLDKVQNTEDIEPILQQIQYTLNRAELKAEMDEMLRVLNTKTQSETQRGLVKGIGVDAVTNQVLNDIRGSFKQMITTDIDERVREVNRQIRDLKAKYGITKVEDGNAEFQAEYRQLRDKYTSLVEQRAEAQKMQAQETEEMLTNRSTEILDEMNDYRDRGEEIPITLVEERIALPIRQQLAQLSAMQKSMDEAEAELKNEREALVGKRGDERKAQIELINNKQKQLIAWQRRCVLMARQIEGDLKDLMSEGKSKRRDAVKKQIEEENHLIEVALEAVKKKRMNYRNQPAGAEEHLNKDWTAGEKFVASLQESWEDKKEGAQSFVQKFNAPVYSFNFLLKYLDRNHGQGDGPLYYMLMKDHNAAVEANDNYADGKVEFGTKIDDQVRKIFGFGLDKLMKESDDRTYKTIELVYNENGNVYTKPVELTKGQALYVWLMSRQQAGKEKLEADGWGPSQMKQVEDLIGEKYIKLGEWITEEFLPQLRADKYNPTYERMYGTSMHMASHYFPIKIWDKAVHEKGEVGEVAIEGMPSASTGNLITRKSNNLPIDTEVNALDLLLEYGDKMERWNSMGDLTQKLNVLLHSNAFRNYIIANDGEGMWDRWKDACSLVTNSYQSKESNELGQFMGKLQNSFMKNAIGYRYYTALKQTLSYPAFSAYSGNLGFQAELLANIARTFGNNKEGSMFETNYSWAMRELPGFRQRVASGDMGIEGLNDDGIGGEIERKFSEYGMAANKAVDARTVAAGARAVYNYEYKEGKKRGLSDAEAKRLARINAEICFNESQQSSRPEFSSPMQKNRDLLSRSTVAFQNSNISYRRGVLEGLNDVLRAREICEAHGNTPEAKAEMRKQISRGVRKMLNFGALLPGLWYIGSNISTLWANSDDDEEDDKFWPNMFANIAMGSLTNGSTVGPLTQALYNSVYKLITDDSQSATAEYNPLQAFELLSEIMDDAFKTYKDDQKAECGIGVSGWAEGLSNWAFRFMGVNPETWANMAIGLTDLAKRGKFELQDAMFVLNVPGSHRRKIVERMARDESASEYMRQVEEASKLYEDGDKRYSKLAQGTKILTDKKRNELLQDYIDCRNPEFAQMMDEIKKFEKAVEKRAEEIKAEMIAKGETGVAELIKLDAMQEVADSGEFDVDLNAYKRMKSNYLRKDNGEFDLYEEQTLDGRMKKIQTMETKYKNLLKECRKAAVNVTDNPDQLNDLVDQLLEVETRMMIEMGK